MVDDVFNTLFSDLISSCVQLEGVVYVPVESFLSSTGAWFTVHVFLWTAIAFVTWQFLSLIKTFVEVVFLLIKRKIQEKKLLSDEDVFLMMKRHHDSLDTNSSS